MNTSKGSVLWPSDAVAVSEAGTRNGVCRTARSWSRTRRQTVEGSPVVSRTRRWEAYTEVTRPLAPLMP